MMTASFLDQWRSWLLRPQVVHRLPGRLRLRFPALRRIDHAQGEWASVWHDLLDGLPAIESVEVNLTTGSVLIHYRPDELAEEELLDFLRAVHRLVLRHWDRLAATPPAELPQVVQRLVHTIRAGIRHRLILDDSFEMVTDA